MILSTILFTSALGIAMPLLLSMVYGMLGGCDCCSPTCSPSCLQAYNVNLQPADDGTCAAGTVTACVGSAVEDDFASPPWSSVTCGQLWEDLWDCSGTDCDTVEHDLGPVYSGTSIGPTLADAIAFAVQSDVTDSFWGKTCLQITGPVSQFCVEWVADSVTSYATYGPIAADATYVLYPIDGNIVTASFVNCGPCAP